MIRLTRRATAPAVESQVIRKGRPLRRGEKRAHVALDLVGVVALGQAKTLRHSTHVRINDNGRHIEARAEHDVGRLSADSGKREQILHGGGKALGKTRRNRF